jgi:hypothetical protein
MSATQFPPAASPQSTSLPPVALTPTGVVSADGVAARATGYRITTRDGYRLAVTASRITPEVLLVVAQPDGGNIPVWVDIATAEQLADALAWECQDARLAGAL